jgi:hypothetical protein
MPKIKTSELQGEPLHYAVAKSDGKLDVCGEVSFIGTDGWCYEGLEAVRYIPSTNWAQGGPIIEREKIAIDFNEFRDRPDGQMWRAIFDGSSVKTNTICYGSTAMVAAMRAYVASKLGDVVDIPDELV